MKLGQYQMILKMIIAGVEGDGFTLDIRTKSGAIWRDVAVARSYAEPAGLVEIVKEDKPPAWIDIETIESITLNRSISKEVTE